MFGYPFRKASEEPAHQGASRSRPKIAVVLGAGAARGWAHIGALQELEAAGVSPDIVVGASIGAVVGGCYAAGRLDELEAFSRSLTKRGVLGLMDVSFAGGGLIGGARLRGRLEKVFAGVKIEDLPMQFAAVATELGSGNEIWLTQGALVDSMRASYALPGVFEPVRWGGRWLIDGALVNPVPVALARAMGAEKVIAVNIVSDMLGRGATLRDPKEGDAAAQEATAEAVVEQVAGGSVGDMLGMRRGAALLRRQFTSGQSGAPGIATVMLDAFNITQDRITRSRLAGDPPDVLITARLGKIGLFEFHRAEELIALGRDAARRALDELRHHVDLLAPAQEPEQPSSKTGDNLLPAEAASRTDSDA
ncbi:MAG TPA: patatin-like phospholipase family protein [Roseiarcus sp.]|nr:patatin-like phospholipase family protein [Roseiarcus sp.]